MRPASRKACVYCGGRPVAPDTDSSERVELKLGVRTCPECRILVAPAFTHCQRCGTRPVLLRLNPSLNPQQRETVANTLTEAAGDVAAEALWELVADGLVSMVDLEV